MQFEEGEIYHVYNRSFERKVIFPQERNYSFFESKLKDLNRHCDILAYCLMPTHFHLMLFIPDSSKSTERTNQMQRLSRELGTLLSSFTQAINKQEKRSGSLFQPKTKAKVLNKKDQVLTCFNYIHQNPLKAGIVPALELWRYSSFNEYYNNKSKLCNVEMGKKLIDLPTGKADFYNLAQPVRPLQAVRRVEAAAQAGRRVAIAGAGLVGSLLAIYLKKRGHNVSVFERRGDMRSSTYEGGRSINLALSNRGIRALEEVGLATTLKHIAIPMHGRMMHDVHGKLSYQAYGKEGQYINSISRSALNIALMNKAEEQGVQFYFESKIEEVDLDKTELKVGGRQSAGSSQRFDVIIGADGAFSAIRDAMRISDWFNYQQFYIEHGYKELTIPSGPRQSFLLEKNALHIWPRESFMLIALPNPDGSFTCTLFFPFEGPVSFESLKSDKAINDFFEQHFTDAKSLMPDLLSDFNENPTSSLVTVKCFPWVKNRTLLMGDAAHAIVPFYGQGMNAGFEDCRILNELLNQFDDNWDLVLGGFQKLRKPDADAIAQLALDNFVEMRDLVADKEFLLRKKIEARLHALFPERWIPLYSMVTFHDSIRYSEALRIGQKQRTIMDEVMQTPDIENCWESIDFLKIVDKLHTV